MMEEIKSMISNRKLPKVSQLLKYGTTFIFFHELLGITSYLVVFSLIYFQVIDIQSILPDFIENNLGDSKIIINYASTAAIVKVMDVFGLVFLRLFLAAYLTAKLDPYIGPVLDRFVNNIKKLKNIFIKSKETKENPQIKD